MSLYILETQISNDDERILEEYESVKDCLEGVCRIYEEHLMRRNPNTPTITYNISQLFSFFNQMVFNEVRCGSALVDENLLLDEIRSEDVVSAGLVKKCCICQIVQFTLLKHDIGFRRDWYCQSCYDVYVGQPTPESLGNISPRDLGSDK